MGRGSNPPKLRELRRVRPIPMSASRSSSTPALVFRSSRTPALAPAPPRPRHLCLLLLLHADADAHAFAAAALRSSASGRQPGPAGVDVGRSAMVMSVAGGCPSLQGFGHDHACLDRWGSAGAHHWAEQTSSPATRRTTASRQRRDRVIPSLFLVNAPSDSLASARCGGGAGGAQRRPSFSRARGWLEWLLHLLLSGPCNAAAALAAPNGARASCGGCCSSSSPVYLGKSLSLNTLELSPLSDPLYWWLLLWFPSSGGRRSCFREFSVLRLYGVVLQFVVLFVVHLFQVPGSSAVRRSSSSRVAAVDVPAGIDSGSVSPSTSRFDDSDVSGGIGFLGQNNSYLIVFARPTGQPNMHEPFLSVVAQDTGTADLSIVSVWSAASAGPGAREREARPCCLTGASSSRPVKPPDGDWWMGSTISLLTLCTAWFGLINALCAALISRSYPPSNAKLGLYYLKEALNVNVAGARRPFHPLSVSNVQEGERAAVEHVPTAQSGAKIELARLAIDGRPISYGPNQVANSGRDDRSGFRTTKSPGRVLGSDHLAATVILIEIDGPLLLGMHAWSPAKCMLDQQQLVDRHKLACVTGIRRAHSCCYGYECTPLYTAIRLYGRSTARRVRVPIDDDTHDALLPADIRVHMIRARGMLCHPLRHCWRIVSSDPTRARCDPSPCQRCMFGLMAYRTSGSAAPAATGGIEENITSMLQSLSLGQQGKDWSAVATRHDDFPVIQARVPFRSEDLRPDHSIISFISRALSNGIEGGRDTLGVRAFLSCVKVARELVRFRSPAPCLPLALMCRTPDARYKNEVRSTYCCPTKNPNNSEKQQLDAPADAVSTCGLTLRWDQDASDVVLIPAATEQTACECFGHGEGRRRAAVSADNSTPESGLDNSTPESGLGVSKLYHIWTGT
nr:unnamed protein product [Digitaria exilis]